MMEKTFKKVHYPEYEGKYDESIWAGYDTIQETDYVRHIRLLKPLTIKIDGMSKEAIVTQ